MRDVQKKEQQTIEQRMPGQRNAKEAEHLSKPSPGRQEFTRGTGGMLEVFVE